MEKTKMSKQPSVDTFSVFADFGTGAEEWKEA